MRPFKFLTNNHKIDWRQTGLLDMVTNEPLMIRVYDITREYILRFNHITNDVMVGMIFPIMYKLFHDKRNDYLDEYIEWRLGNVIEYIGSEEIRIYVNDLLTNAWMTVDVEAEMVHITAEKYRWNEN